MIPEVSVVIPTRDRRRWLERAVACSLAQQDVSVEVIVVDDGSAEPASRPAEDRRVTVIRHEASRGVAAARNAGIAAARAPWIAFLDDDDVVAPDHLKLLRAAAGDGAAMAFSRHYVISADGTILSVGPNPLTEVSMPELLRGNPVVTPSSVLARREALESVGGFDPAFSILADWDLWIRLAELGVVACSGALTAGYTQHGSNMAGDRPTLLREHRALAAKHAALLDRESTGLGDDLFWQWWAAGVRPDRQRRLGARHYLGQHRGRTRRADQARALTRMARAPRLPLASRDSGGAERLAWLAPAAP